MDYDHQSVISYQSSSYYNAEFNETSCETESLFFPHMYHSSYQNMITAERLQPQIETGYSTILQQVSHYRLDNAAGGSLQGCNHHGNSPIIPSGTELDPKRDQVGHNPNIRSDYPHQHGISPPVVHDNSRQHQGGAQGTTPNGHMHKHRPKPSGGEQEIPAISLPQTENNSNPADIYQARSLNEVVSEAIIADLKQAQVPPRTKHKRKGSDYYFGKLRPLRNRGKTTEKQTDNKGPDGPQNNHTTDDGKINQSNGNHPLNLCPTRIDPAFPPFYWSSNTFAHKVSRQQLRLHYQRNYIYNPANTHSYFSTSTAETLSPTHSVDENHFPSQSENRQSQAHPASHEPSWEFIPVPLYDKDPSEITLVTDKNYKRRQNPTLDHMTHRKPSLQRQIFGDTTQLHHQKPSLEIPLPLNKQLEYRYAHLSTSDRDSLISYRVIPCIYRNHPATSGINPEASRAFTAHAKSLRQPSGNDDVVESDPYGQTQQAQNHSTLYEYMANIGDRAPHNNENRTNIKYRVPPPPQDEMPTARKRLLEQQQQQQQQQHPSLQLQQRRPLIYPHQISLSLSSHNGDLTSPMAIKNAASLPFQLASTIFPPIFTIPQPQSSPLRYPLDISPQLTRAQPHISHGTNHAQESSYQHANTRYHRGANHFTHMYPTGGNSRMQPEPESHQTKEKDPHHSAQRLQSLEHMGKHQPKNTITLPSFPIPESISIERPPVEEPLPLHHLVKKMKRSQSNHIHARPLLASAAYEPTTQKQTKYAYVAYDDGVVTCEEPAISPHLTHYNNHHQQAPQQGMMLTQQTQYNAPYDEHVVSMNQHIHPMWRVYQSKPITMKQETADSFQRNTPQHPLQKKADGMTSNLYDEVDESMRPTTQPQYIAASPIRNSSDSSALLSPTIMPPVPISPLGVLSDTDTLFTCIELTSSPHLGSYTDPQPKTIRSYIFDMMSPHWTNFQLFQLHCFPLFLYAFSQRQFVSKLLPGDHNSSSQWQARYYQIRRRLQQWTRMTLFLFSQGLLFIFYLAFVGLVMKDQHRPDQGCEQVLLTQPHSPLQSSMNSSKSRSQLLSYNPIASRPVENNATSDTSESEDSTMYDQSHHHSANGLDLPSHSIPHRPSFPKLARNNAPVADDQNDSHARIATHQHVSPSIDSDIGGDDIPTTDSSDIGIQLLPLPLGPSAARHQHRGKKKRGKKFFISSNYIYIRIAKAKPSVHDLLKGVAFDDDDDDDDEIKSEYDEDNEEDGIEAHDNDQDSIESNHHRYEQRNEQSYNLLHRHYPHARVQYNQQTKLGRDTTPSQHGFHRQPPNRTGTHPSNQQHIHPHDQYYNEYAQPLRSRGSVIGTSNNKHHKHEKNQYHSNVHHSSSQVSAYSPSFIPRSQFPAYPQKSHLYVPPQNGHLQVTCEQCENDESPYHFLQDRFRHHNEKHQNGMACLDDAHFEHSIPQPLPLPLHHNIDKGGDDHDKHASSTYLPQHKEKPLPYAKQQVCEPNQLHQYTSAVVSTNRGGGILHPISATHGAASTSASSQEYHPRRLFVSEELNHEFAQIRERFYMDHNDYNDHHGDHGQHVDPHNGYPLREVKGYPPRHVYETVTMNVTADKYHLHTNHQDRQHGVSMDTSSRILTGLQPETRYHPPSKGNSPEIGINDEGSIGGEPPTLSLLSSLRSTPPTADLGGNTPHPGHHSCEDGIDAIESTEFNHPYHHAENGQGTGIATTHDEIHLDGEDDEEALPPPVLITTDSLQHTRSRKEKSLGASTSSSLSTLSTLSSGSDFSHDDSVSSLELHSKQSSLLTPSLPPFSLSAPDDHASRCSSSQSSTSLLSASQSTSASEHEILSEVNTDTASKDSDGAHIIQGQIWKPSSSMLDDNTPNIDATPHSKSEIASRCNEQQEVNVAHDLTQAVPTHTDSAHLPSTAISTAATLTRSASMGRSSHYTRTTHKSGNSDESMQSGRKRVRFANYVVLINDFINSQDGSTHHSDETEDEMDGGGQHINSSRTTTGHVPVSPSNSPHCDNPAPPQSEYDGDASNSESFTACPSSADLGESSSSPQHIASCSYPVGSHTLPLHHPLSALQSPQPHHTASSQHPVPVIPPDQPIAMKNTPEDVTQIKNNKYPAISYSSSSTLQPSSGLRAPSPAMIPPSPHGSMDSSHPKQLPLEDRQYEPSLTKAGRSGNFLMTPPAPISGNHMQQQQQQHQLDQLSLPVVSSPLPPTAIGPVKHDAQHSSPLASPSPLKKGRATIITRVVNFRPTSPRGMIPTSKRLNRQYKSTQNNLIAIMASSHHNMNHSHHDIYPPAGEIAISALTTSTGLPYTLSCGSASSESMLTATAESVSPTTLLSHYSIQSDNLDLLIRHQSFTAPLLSRNVSYNTKSCSSYS